MAEAALAEVSAVFPVALADFPEAAAVLEAEAPAEAFNKLLQMFFQYGIIKCIVHNVQLISGGKQCRI